MLSFRIGSTLHADEGFFLTVQTDPEGCSGSFRIGKLDIFTSYLDVSVLCGDPLVSRISAAARFDKVRFQFRFHLSAFAVDVHISVVRSIIWQFCKVSAIIVCHTVVPAICSRCSTEVFLQVGDFHVWFRRYDGHSQSAGIPCVVAVGADPEGDYIVFLHFQFFDAEVNRIVFTLLNFNFMVLDFRIVLVDIQCYAIRPVRIAIIMSELDIITGDVNVSIFRDNPPIERIHVSAWMDIVFLDFHSVIS